MGGFRTFTETVHTRLAMKLMIITESRGKLLRWHGFAIKVAPKPISLMTAGYVHLYPSSLDLLGFKPGDEGVHEFGRIANAEFLNRLRRDLQRLPADGVILIATDNDREGDVIAFDVLEAILAHDVSLLSRTLRVHPSEMTWRYMRMAVLDAIDDAMHAPSATSRYVQMKQAAVPGRTRAVVDRLFGSAYLNDSGANVGRVKAAALGAVRLRGKRPEASGDILETGEIRLRVAAADGGAAFTATVPLHGRARGDLCLLAERFRGTEVPGRIAAAKPAGAAVAPRDGRPALLNVGDALILGERYYGLSILNTKKALEAGYAAGIISYPRTAERHISQASVRQVAEIARRCDVPGVPDPEWCVSVSPSGAHEALHPTHLVPTDDIKEHFSEKQRKNRSNTKVVSGLITECCFEVMRPNPLTWGCYRPEPGGDLSKAEIKALEQLDWTRHEAEPLHKGPPAGTELRLWQPGSIMVNILMSEDLGRPSSLANHAHALAVSGWLHVPGDGRPPKLTPKGESILSLLPAEAADPETSRRIERILDERLEWDPDGSAPMAQCVMWKLRRVMDACGGIRERLQAALMRDEVKMHDACRNAPTRSDSTDAKPTAAKKPMTAKMKAEIKKNKEIRDALKMREEKEKKDAHRAMLIDNAAAQGLFGVKAESRDAGAQNLESRGAEAAPACVPHDVQECMMDATALGQLSKAMLMADWAQAEWQPKGGAVQAPDGAHEADAPRPDQQRPEPCEPEPLEPDPPAPDAQELKPREPKPREPKGDANQVPDGAHETDAPRPDQKRLEPCEPKPLELAPPEPDAQELKPREPEPREPKGDADQVPDGAHETDAPRPDQQGQEPCEPEPLEPDPPEPDAQKLKPREPEPREPKGDADQAPDGAHEADVPRPDQQRPEPCEPEPLEPDPPAPDAQELKPCEPEPHEPDAQQLEPPGPDGRERAEPVDKEREAAAPTRDPGPLPDVHESPAIATGIRYGADIPGLQAQTRGAPKPDAHRREPAMWQVEADAAAAGPVDGAMQDANAVYVVDDPDEDGDFMNQEFLTAPGDAAQASADAPKDRPDAATWANEWRNDAPIEAPDAAAKAPSGIRGDAPDAPAPQGRIGESRNATRIEAPEDWPDGAAQGSAGAPKDPPDMAAPHGWADESQGGAPIRKPDDGPGAPAPAPIDAPEPPHAAMRAPDGVAGGQPAAANVPPQSPESPGTADGSPDGAGSQAPQEQHHQQMEEHHAQRPKTQKIAASPQPSHRERQGPEPPDQGLQARAARAPEPQARHAHEQEMTEPAPHGAAPAHGHAVQPVEHITREMEPVEGGFVTERVIEQGNFTVWVFEFYTRDRFLDFMEVRDSAGQRHQFKYDERANDMLPVASDDERTDPRIRWRARRATPKPRPPEPDYDYDYDEEYDYDDDCSPGM